MILHKPGPVWSHTSSAGLTPLASTFGPPAARARARICCAMAPHARHGWLPPSLIHWLRLCQLPVSPPRGWPLQLCLLPHMNGGDRLLPRQASWCTTNSCGCLKSLQPLDPFLLPFWSCDLLKAQQGERNQMETLLLWIIKSGNWREGIQLEEEAYFSYLTWNFQKRSHSGIVSKHFLKTNYCSETSNRTLKNASILTRNMWKSWFFSYYSAFSQFPHPSLVLHTQLPNIGVPCFVAG